MSLTHDGHELTFLDIETDAPDSLNEGVPGAVMFNEVICFNKTHGHLLRAP